MRKFSGRSLTIAYVAALAIIAVMTLVSHLTLSRILQESEGAASVINISGRQRMLSQRIASLAAQWARGDQTARQDLSAALDQFETTHQALLEGSRDLHLPPASGPELQAIYAEGPNALNKEVARFVSRGRQIAALGSSDPRMEAELRPLFAEARQPVLSGLEAVVQVHERTSRRQMVILEWTQTISLVVVLATLVGEALAIFRPMVRKITVFSNDLIRIAMVDPLTGAVNRRSFSDRTLVELERARRYQRPVSVLMLDVDLFKTINDTFGHGGGDAVLRGLADALMGTLRPSDLLGRLGGEEFAVLLPEIDLAGARAAAERLRVLVAGLAILHDDAEIRFTVSIGAAQFEAGADELQPTLDRADAALYQAKLAGRNRVMTAPATQPVAAGSAPARPSSAGQSSGNSAGHHVGPIASAIRLSASSSRLSTEP